MRLFWMWKMLNRSVSEVGPIGSLKGDEGGVVDVVVVVVPPVVVIVVVVVAGIRNVVCGPASGGCASWFSMSLISSSNRMKRTPQNGRHAGPQEQHSRRKLSSPEFNSVR